MAIVKKIDGQWVALSGIVDLQRTVSVRLVNYHDGRTVEEPTEPYPVDDRLDIQKVERLLGESTWTADDLAPYGLKQTVPFVVPDGKRIVGSVRYVEDGDTVRDDYDVEDIPPQRLRIPKSVLIERLTDEQLAEAMSLMSLRQQEMWRAPDRPWVYADDPDLLLIINAIGADAATVLAP